MKVGPDGGEITISSQSMKVGDIIKVNQNERVPADLIMLYTTEEESGDVFIRTDQLDGETDWKLRRAIQTTQASYQAQGNFANHDQAYVKAAPPSKAIYEF